MPNKKHPKPSPVQPAVTWADLVHIANSHGISPVDPGSLSGGLLPTVYAAWLRAEGLDPTRSYAMPVHLLTGHVRHHLRATEDRWLHDRGLRALLVNELNSPACGVVIVQRPFRTRRAA